MRRNQLDLEIQIRKLRNDLWVTRMALVGMAPIEFRDLFIGIHSCKARKDAYEWQTSAVKKMVERVKPRSAEEMGDLPYNGPRAYCPICGGSSDNIHQIQGFAYPEGLRRHLEGSFNARHCEVMKAALALACDSAERGEVRASVVGRGETLQKRRTPRAKR